MRNLALNQKLLIFQVRDVLLGKLERRNTSKTKQDEGKFIVFEPNNLQAS